VILPHDQIPDKAADWDSVLHTSALIAHYKNAKESGIGLLTIPATGSYAQELKCTPASLVRSDFVLTARRGFISLSQESSWNRLLILSGTLFFRGDRHQPDTVS
jgi:hypothetical protein